MSIIFSAAQIGAERNSAAKVHSTPNRKPQGLSPAEQEVYDEGCWNDGGPGGRSSLEKYRRSKSRRMEN